MISFTHILQNLSRRAWRWARKFAGRPAEDPVARVYWDDSVTLTLSNLAQETETRASGRVQVISLADFRASIGELWEKYQTKILIITESTIGRMMGKGNTYLPQGDDAWLLLFPGLPSDKAQQRADAIAASIGEKLMGAQFTAHEVPLPAASKLDLSGALNADGSLNMEAVKSAISKIRQAQISTVAANSRNIKTVPRAAVTPAGTVMRSAAEQYKPFFHQAWCAETESIDLFLFRAASETGQDVYAQDAPPMNDATVLDLTKSAAAAFVAMCETGLNAKMGLPVPFSALHGSALTEIQRLVANLRQRDRLLRLRLEVVQIPSQATADTLVAIRELFRPYVREVAFAVDLLSPNDQVLVLDHIMLGADAGALAGTSDEQLFQDMMIFRQRAGRRGTYVTGLQTRGHLRRAIGVGIAEVGGTALTQDVKRLPHRVTIVPREQLLAP